MSNDNVLVKALLKCAYLRGDQKAADHLIQFGLISNKSELMQTKVVSRSIEEDLIDGSYLTGVEK